MTRIEGIGTSRFFATRLSRRRARVLLLLVCAAVAGCGGSDDPMVPPDPPRDSPRAAAISISPSAASLTYVGETATFQATVTDQHGAAFSGSVSWVSSAPQAFTVNANGVATAVANGSGTVTASVQGVSGSASVVVEQLPTALAVVSGDDQEGRPGRSLPLPLTVRAADAGGAPVADVAVEFVPAEGSGQVSQALVVTDAVGEAATLWTLGDSFGAQSVAASLTGGASAILTATALRPEALVDSIVVVSGDGQMGRITTALRDEIVVRAVDAQGLPVDGAAVQFEVPTGHGRAMPDSATTDEAGLARTAWTLGNKKGLQLLTVTVPGHASARLTATGLFGEALELVSGDLQSAGVGTELAEPVVLRVRDQRGEVLEGVSVRFTPNRGHGVVSPDSVASDASGEAATAWTLGDAPGIQTLTAVVVGGDVRTSVTARGKSGLGVCDRTPQIRDAIMAQVGIGDCAAVTAEGLGRVYSLDLEESPTITSLYEDDFAGLHNLMYLNLGDNRIRQLPPGVFSDLSLLTSLQLRENQIRELPVGVFSGLLALESLALQNNQLRSLPEGIFAGLSNLKRLQLGRNQINELGRDLFSDLINIERLSLWDNELRELPKGIFGGLMKLRYLRLEYNRLGEHQLDIDLFADLIGLEDLDLRRNEFNELPGILSELTELRRLRLRGNKISSVPTDAFAKLTKLQYLDLSDNDILEVPQSLFSGLADLEWLDLTQNELSALPASIFSGLAKLERLTIWRNRLTELSPGLFSGLTNLRHLGLNSNLLGDLPANAFSGLPSLEYLSLGGNPIGTLPEGIFTELPSLTELGLWYTELTELDGDVFADLPNLEDVSIAGNGLTTIPSDLFGSNMKLIDVSVAGNELATLPPDLFRNNRELEAVRLNSLQLQELPSEVFSGLARLRWVWLHENPGSPFPFAVRLERTDTTDWAAPGPAILTATVSEGAPFEIRIHVSAPGASLSSATLAIPTGKTRSNAIKITPASAGTVTVAPGSPPDVPDTICRRVHSSDGVRLYPCYQGITVVSGAPITLFR